MKIAIQGHPTRGHEVIQILESLGGKKTKLTGTFSTFYHLSDKNEIINNHKKFLSSYKLYTLEEFEKEFPFKVGDIVLLKGLNKPYEIIALELYMDKLCYKLDSGLHYRPETLITYKEMKEERNITLTLDKAKEWYKKGGELKEIALQAFTEQELNSLPKSWKEYCENYPIKPDEAVIYIDSKIITCDGRAVRHPLFDRRACPSKKSAEAHLAMIQLEQLRDCWRQDWEPDWLNGNEKKYAIKGWRDKSSIEVTYVTHAFLSFPTYELALKFQECFRDLIEKAGDLI